MSSKDGYSTLKPLLDFQQDLKLKYNLTKTSIGYEISIDKASNPYAQLREIPRDRLSIPEQLLLNILIHQPCNNGVYQIQKEYLERVVYYLQDIDPGLVQGINPADGKLKLKYLLEVNRQYCRLNVDLSQTPYKGLRELPKEELPICERVFISFLAGVPINGGSFFINQHLLAKLFYFLTKIENVYDKASLEKILIDRNNLSYKIVLNKASADYLITIEEQSANTALLLRDLQILGDKQYLACYKKKYYLLRNIDYLLLSFFIKEKNFRFNDHNVADFLSDYLPILENNGVNFELRGGLEELQKSIITAAPVPILELKSQNANQLAFSLLYDYGLSEKVVYSPSNLDNFYQVKVNDHEYFLKRDKKSEDWLNQYLEERRFVYAKKYYQINEDDFIDFFSYEYDGLNKNIGLQITGSGLDKFRYREEMDFDIDVNFQQASGIDWFDFQPTYQVKGTTFTHDQIKTLVDNEKEYVRLADGTIVKVPLKEYQYLQSYLEGRKAESKTGKYKVKKYDIFYLFSSIRNILKAKVDQSLQNLLAGLENFQGIPEVQLPENIKGIPRKYQHEGFNWLYFLHQNSFHGILADDMGLGKTFQVLLLLDYLKQKGLKTGPSLIVAPTSVVYNWVAEVNKFTPELKVLILSGSKDRILKVKEAVNYDIVITSYALLRNDLEHYAKVSFYYMILDEAQAIKNYKAQISKAVKCISAQYRLAMTGTPIENRLSELWSLFDFLMPGFLSTATYFRSVYDPDAERLRRKIKPFVMRRTKAEVLSDLPPKNEIDSFTELLPEQEQVYLAVLQAQKKELFSLLKDQDVSRIQLNILASLLKLRQICCHPALLNNEKLITESAKFNQFKEILAEILESGDKVIVFSQFVQMLTIIRKYLETEKVDYCYLDGSTKDRQGAIDYFNSEEKVKVFLCSLKAGGLGINLTSANYVIIYDPWWNPAVEQQAMDRVYRIGQKKEVFVYKLITKGTVEEKILKLQEKKRDLVDSVIISKKISEKQITKADLEELFSY